MKKAKDIIKTKHKTLKDRKKAKTKPKYKKNLRLKMIIKLSLIEKKCVKMQKKLFKNKLDDFQVDDWKISCTLDIYT